MFRKRSNATATDQTVVADGGPPSVAERPWYGPTRAITTLIAIAVAGLLVWLATQVNDKTTGGYWAEYGLLAGAGLVLAFSQLLGGWTKFGMPRMSGSVFLLAFIPALIVGGWIVLFHQPHPNWFRNHIRSWSGDIGVTSFVGDMRDMLGALSLGLGVVFGYTFDTTGPRLRKAAATREVSTTLAAPAPADRAATDAPMTAERGVSTPGPAERGAVTTPQRSTPEE